MQAIKQIIKVVDHKFSVLLPDYFDAKTVEVIILASNEKYNVPEWQQIESERRYNEYLKNPEIAFTNDAFINKIDAL